MIGGELDEFFEKVISPIILHNPNIPHGFTIRIIYVWDYNITK